MAENDKNEMNFVTKSLTPTEQAIIEKAATAKARRKGRKLVEVEGLTITSLMDALTILLTFLLITLTSDPLNIKMDSTLLLAKSTTRINPEDAIPITISKSYISVDQKNAVRVDCRMANGKMCTEKDFGRKIHCDLHQGECSPEEKAALNTMYYFVDKSYKENGDENSFLIEPLMKALAEKVQFEKEENAELGRKFKGAINIMCDRDISFRVITEVVYTAGLAELSNIRFAAISSFER